MKFGTDTGECGKWFYKFVNASVLILKLCHLKHLTIM